MQIMAGVSNDMSTTAHTGKLSPCESVQSLPEENAEASPLRVSEPQAPNNDYPLLSETSDKKTGAVSFGVNPTDTDRDSFAVKGTTTDISTTQMGSAQTIRRTQLPPKNRKQFDVCKKFTDQSSICIDDVWEVVEEAEKSARIAEQASSDARFWRKMAVVFLIFSLVLLAGMFGMSILAIQLTKEIRATSGGVLQTQDGNTALVGSSDTQVGSQGELTSRDGGRAISTASASVSISFRKLAIAASNRSLITPLLTDAATTSHINPDGEVVQSKVRRAWSTSSKTGSQVSLSLDPSDNAEGKETLHIDKAVTTYVSSDQIYDTSGEVSFQLTPRSEASWQTIVAMQGSTDDNAPWAASNLRLGRLQDEATNLNSGCADMMTKAFSKEAMENPALDSLDYQRFRKIHQPICDLNCQGGNGCINASSHCTSQTFRALDDLNQTTQLFDACESFLQPQASVMQTEDDLNINLHENNEKNNASFAYGGSGYGADVGGGRRLGGLRRLYGSRRRRRAPWQSWGRVGCCSSSIGMIGNALKVSGAAGDASSCVDHPEREHDTPWKLISACCKQHDFDIRENTPHDTIGEHNHPHAGHGHEESAKWGNTLNCNAREAADKALAECAMAKKSKGCNWWDYKCKAYHLVIWAVMAGGKPNGKTRGPCKK